MTDMDPLRRAWAERRPTYGVFLTQPSPIGAEALVRPGIDWVCADLQHGAISRSASIALNAAISSRGAVPIARVAAVDETAIGHALDDGARAVIVPLVDDAAAAERAVAACRFPPRGRRSYGPGRVGVATGAWEPQDVERVGCLVMVETAAGLAAVEAIAATPGIDGVVVGPSDLAISLGRSPSVAHTDPTVGAAIARIRDVTVAAGLVAGIVCPDGGTAGRYAREGFGMIALTTDLALLLDGIARELAAAGVGTDG